MSDVASRPADLGGRLLQAAALLGTSAPGVESRTAAVEAVLREVAAACEARGARVHVAIDGVLPLTAAVGTLAIHGPTEGPTLVAVPVLGLPPVAPDGAGGPPIDDDPGVPADPAGSVLQGRVAPAPARVTSDPLPARAARANARANAVATATATERVTAGATGADAAVDTAAARPAAPRSGAPEPAVEPSGPILGTLWLDEPHRDAATAARLLGMALQMAAASDRIAYADRRFAALDDAIRAMTSLLAVDRVLQAIVDRARELVGARYAALGISDVDGRIEQFITSGMTRSERARIGAPPHGKGLLGAILHENRTIRIDDVLADPRRVGFPPAHPVMHAFLGVPVRVRGRTIGNLYLTEKDGGFTDEDVRVVETFARHAGIAMENARLHEQVQRLAVVEERERIGRDLHDGIIQSIYAVGLSLEDVPDMLDSEPDEASRRVERAIDSLDQTIRDIRNFIFGLRPQLLEGVRLVEGLDALADEFRVNTMIDIELRVGPDARDVPISPTRTMELLAIYREGLSNVARHARASRATITVLPEPDGPGLVIELADNGIGFDPNAVRSGSHQGLRNIRGRAAAIEAILEIDSRAGAGTRIIVRVPPDRAEEESGDEAQEERDAATGATSRSDAPDSDGGARGAQHQQGGSNPT